MSSKNSTRRLKWALDLAPRSKAGRQSQEASFRKLTAPLGFTKKKMASDPARNDGRTEEIIIRKSWDIVVYGPLKQVAINLCLMWIAANEVLIMSIMMLGVMFMQPVRALWSIQQTFKKIKGNQAMVQRIGYLLGILFALVLAVYKSHMMGLLPILLPSDWLAYVKPQKRLEWSEGGMIL